MRFENKVILITGGTSGIGLATAKLFAAEGAHVVIVGRDQDKTTEAARDFRGRGEAGDVSSAADCERIVARTLSLHSRLDVLVNCAGVIFRNRTVEEYIRRRMGYNLRREREGYVPDVQIRAARAARDDRVAS